MLVSSGGVYKEDDDRDALTRQIRHGFEFIGINEIDVVWAEGQNPLFFDNSEENKAVAMEAATEVAEEIAEIEL
jgi:FMN-dependent NADH-azoreductase